MSSFIVTGAIASNQTNRRHRKEKTINAGAGAFGSTRSYVGKNAVALGEVSWVRAALRENS
jgi:hypothetical protein